MDLFSHYSRLLSIGDGWKVADVKLEMGQLRVDIYLDNNEKCAPYSECVQRLNGVTNDWSVSVWENTGERDMRRSAYFDPTPRQLVKSRHVACGPDGIRIRADIHNGRMTLSVNGETITPQPLDFALDGENGWYPFNFRQQYMAGRTDWTYEAECDLLTHVKNTAFGSVVSQYDYVNDALGRRTEIARTGTRMTESRIDAYGYNDRNELTNAVKNAALSEYAYQYDDIGNRTAALDLGTNHTYTANSLNQYTQISNLCDSASLREEFFPQFDDDGNQTLIKTATGIWQVSYNAENRPVLWECGSTNIVMKFDRMGRRVEYVETVTDSTGGPSAVSATTNAHHRFVYDGYLCIQRLNAAANNSIDLVFGWDPTEPVATRLLVLQKYGQYNLFYTHDGNKNVSELVFFQQANGIAAHYEYAPFGAVTATTTNNALTAFNVAEANPFRFSSEYADDALGLVYYNYRHYNHAVCRWLCRDALGEDVSTSLYQFCAGRCFEVDIHGLSVVNSSKCPIVVKPENVEDKSVVVMPGEKHSGRQDGVYRCCERKDDCVVFKTVDYVNVTVTDEGFETSGWLGFAGFVQKCKGGGCKGKEFLSEYTDWPKLSDVEKLCSEAIKK